MTIEARTRTVATFTAALFVLAIIVAPTTKHPGGPTRAQSNHIIETTR